MISAIVHTYNEEKNISRCLASLTFADEIILVDMGSNDRTVEIAKKYNVRVYNYPYTGFVEPARNFGISKASGKWIIVLDADEEIQESLATYLKSQSEKGEFDYYRVPRKNIIFGKWIEHTGWWPDYQIRFFKKGAVSWSEKIHAIPQTKGKGNDIKPDRQLSIIHQNYQSVDQFIGRLNRYTSVEASELHLSGRHFTISSLFEHPVAEFSQRFFASEGYRDGLHGLALSMLQSVYVLIVELKLWESEGFREQKINLSEVRKLFNRVHKIKYFWLIQALLKQPRSYLGRIILKLKRKLFYNA